MKKIKEYTTKKRKQTRYKFTIFVGSDPTTGNPIQVTRKGFKSYDDALLAYAKVNEEIKKGTYLSTRQKRYKVCDLVEMWTKEYKVNVEVSTYARITKLIDKHILPQLGNIYLDKLTVIHCKNAVETWEKDAPASFKTFISYTNSIFDYGVGIEVLQENVMRKYQKGTPRLKHTKRNDKPFTDYYDKTELDKYLTTCKEHMPLKVYVYFRLLAYTGMRRGESLALEWSDIDFNNKSISINKTQKQGEHCKTYIGLPKTKSSNRTIDIDDLTLTILKQWHVQQRKDMFKLGYNNTELVFTDLYNRMLYPAKPEYWNNKLCKKYGLRHIKIHGFRHTHASLLFEAGVPMQDVKERLGHSNIATTMDIYTHVTKTKKRESADKFARFMQN